MLQSRIRLPRGVFGIEAPAFGLALRNPLAIDADRGVATVRQL